MFLIDVMPDVVGFAAFGISFLLLLGTYLFYRHSRKELDEIGQPRKRSNIQQLQKRSELADSLMLRLEEKQRDYFSLKNKYHKLEERTEEIKYMSIELEETRSLVDQLVTEKEKRENRIAGLETENGELREEIHHIRRDLIEAMQENQRLQKKISMMADLETEWQMVVEKNHQLQTKVRRIGELESLLSLMREERTTTQPLPNFTA
jgi:hypothetical protein